MQITLPDDPRLRDQALAAGFATVEEYLLKLVERDGRQQVPRDAQGRRQQSNEEWIREFRAFIQSLPPGNPNFDDSRESIYPVR
jgi:hypothetical protein